MGWLGAVRGCASASRIVVILGVVLIACDDPSQIPPALDTRDCVGRWVAEPRTIFWLEEIDKSDELSRATSSVQLEEDGSFEVVNFPVGNGLTSYRLEGGRGSWSLVRLGAGWRLNLLFETGDAKARSRALISIREFKGRLQLSVPLTDPDLGHGVIYTLERREPVASQVAP